MTAITADRLTRKFGDLTAVDDMTFDIPSGGVVGFVEPNGSGRRIHEQRSGFSAKLGGEARSLRTD